MQSITVSNQIIEVLNYLGEKFGIVIDWSSQNIIPYIEELCGKFISWEIATSYMWIVFGGIFLLLGIFFIGYEIYNQFMYCDGLLFGLGFVMLIIAFCVIGNQIYDIITATCFPEKTILDYIQYQMSTLK
jgi:hypothetical protein